MHQEVAIFDSYGDRAYIEETLNEWLHREPRHVLSIQANEDRLFVRWRKGNGHHRRAPSFFKLFSTATNGNTPEVRFQEFLEEHPGIQIICEACNMFFLFWLWADEV